MPEPAPNPGRESWAARLLHRLAELVLRYPRWFFYPQVFLFLGAIGYTIIHLQFFTSRDALVGAHQRYHRNFLEFKKEFPVQDDLVVVVESGDLQKNREFVERLGARLERETNLFTDVFYKGDLPMLGRKALLFVPEEDLKELQRTLEQFQPFIRHFAQATNLNALFELINTQFRTAQREDSQENRALAGALPALERILAQGLESLRRSGTPVSPGLNALFGSSQEAESRLYITFNQGRIYLVTARPRFPEVGPDAVDRLRDLAHQTEYEVPGVNVGITGELVLEVDEMAQSQRDTTVATIVALLVCAVIFIYGYQETGRPIKATICLVVGIAYTMAFTTGAVGHLNILTITFVPILIGLAIDFGVHLISRYEEELRHGGTESAALHKAMVNTGIGIFTGCLTTAGAFLAIGLTDFKGIQEMGIICGGGLIVSLVPMITLLPVLLLRGRQNVMDHALAGRPERRARIEQIWLARPVMTLAVCVAMCAAGAWQLRNLRFDYNLLHMQSAGLPAVEFEQKLINSAGKSVLYCALVATNLQHALELERRATNLPTVASVDSMASILSGDQTRKLELVGQIKRTVAPIQFAETEAGPANFDALSQTLWGLSGYLGNALEELGNTEPELTKNMRALQSVILEFRKELYKGAPEVVAAKLAAYQKAFFGDVRQTFATLRTQDDTGPLRAEDLPSALRNRFIGRTSKLLVMVYPKKDVWEREPQAEFIADLRQVDPDVTGTPVQLYEYISLLLNSYVKAAKYALVAIALLVFIQFRSVVAVFLALVPVFIGALWMTGMMAWHGVMFNPANIMTLPLVIGIGVTNGIHVLTRFREEESPSIFSRSTGKAVLVSGLTTIAGFGSLMLAKHQGIASLGFVMSIGVATCMVAGVTILPAILTLLGRLGWRLKK